MRCQELIGQNNKILTIRRLLLFFCYITKEIEAGLPVQMQVQSCYHQTFVVLQLQTLET